MRALLILLCLATSQAWATKYVRSDCGLNGNGTDYACAASGGGVGAWNAWTASAIQTSPAVGETVKSCGDFNATHSDTGTTMIISNFTNSDVKIDGDCSAEGGAFRSTWDGQRILARGVDSSAAGRSAVTVRNIDFTGFTLYTIIGQNTTSDDWLIEDITCDGSVTTSQCIRIAAGNTGWVIRDSTFRNCYDDCIFTGAPVTLQRLVGREWSVGTAAGDFLQSSNTDCDGFVFEDLDLESSKDIKQAIIANGCPGATNVTLTGGRFVKLGQSEDTVNGFVPLFFDGPSGTVTARRVYASGGRINLFVTGGVSLLVEGSVFGPATNTNVHCGTSTTACTVRNNTINGASASSAALEMQAPGAGALAVNNAIVGTIGINRGASGVETNNTIIATTPCYVSGSPGSCDASDNTSETTMGWRGGTNPTDASGYRLNSTSPLRRVCKDLNLGNIQDNGNRAFLHPPSCGGWEATTGDQAAARTMR